MDSKMRSIKLIVLCTLVLIATSAWADQITLKNGDRVTGAIVKMDGGTLTIKSALMGQVTVPWNQVSEIKSDAPLNVVLPSGTVQATVATSDGKLQLEGKQQAVPFSEVTALRNADEQKAYERVLHPGWGQLWAGTASLGFAGTSGNARTLTFTTGVNAARLTKTDKTSVYFSAIKASALVNGKNSDTAQAVRGGVGYDHNVSSRLFVNVFNDWEYDRFQNLDLRFVLGGGLGFHVVKTERSKLDLLAGIDFNHSSFSTPLTRNSAEFFWGDEYALKLSGATSLVQSYRMFDDLTNTGTYRVNFDVGLATKLSKWLTWNVSLSDRYLNHPAPGRKTNDFLYTTGIGITFAR
jgi:putative salt-induced outer membrane protein YdiY